MNKRLLLRLRKVVVNSHRRVAGPSGNVSCPSVVVVLSHWFGGSGCYAYVRVLHLARNITCFSLSKRSCRRWAIYLVMAIAAISRNVDLGTSPAMLFNHLSHVQVPWEPVCSCDMEAVKIPVSDRDVLNCLVLVQVPSASHPGLCGTAMANVAATSGPTWRGIDGAP